MILPQTVREQIVAILLKQPGLTAESIMTKVNRHGRQPSIQAIYLELRHLKQGMVIVQINQKFFLSLTWLSSRMDMFEKALGKYQSEDILTNFVPEPGSSLKWHVRDFIAMDSVVVNLMLNILKKSEDKTIYQWDPIPWYLAFDSQLVSPYLDAFKKHNYNAQVVVGSEAPYFRQLLKNKTYTGYQWWIGNIGASFGHNCWIRCAGDFIVKIRVGSESIETLQKIFSVFDKQALPGLIQCLNRQHQIEISFLNNKKQAQKIKKTFSQIF